MTNTNFKKGFTLIEVMMAMTIFTIAILAITSLQTGSVKGNNKARNVTILAGIASNHCEMLQSLPYIKDMDIEGHPLIGYTQNSALAPTSNDLTDTSDNHILNMNDSYGRPIEISWDVSSGSTSDGEPDDPDANPTYNYDMYPDTKTVRLKVSLLDDAGNVVQQNGRDMAVYMSTIIPRI